MSELASHLPAIGRTALGRRGLLLGLSALAAAGPARLALGAGPAGEARLVVVLLRGAMDGLAVVQPYAEPDFAELRGPLALPEPGQEGGVLDLGGRFGLHPGLPNLHRIYGEGGLLVVHAVAGPYRTRSHFDAQDLLESGADRTLSSGWLNRAISGLPQEGQRARTGLAVGTDLPLLLRGPAPVGMYAAPRSARPEADLYARLLELSQADPVLGPAVAEGLRARGYAGEVLGRTARRNGFVPLAAAAGQILAAPDGPRVAALELGGWDTHAGQQNRLRGVLRELDEGLAWMQANLGEAWTRTAVLVMTEFGRTVRVNGNLGTDHGTGGVAFLAGGAVAGGRVAGDWPGLKPGSLFENRDLQPTTDLRALVKGLLRDHLRLPAAAIARAFPDSDSTEAMGGLLA
ncbi:DUF1501 domain-containing protein [Roseomonas sp. OT10]|uniref:DUF1501 domain-containing protein n=1 Tax=Roseomonas cutis TaxID=2897332 RepID=UPI001E607235|nr:DUF1501 domain-containing protein [Roseomonas sp. OT10]UFN48823.1 DUF1501 domain-containing protein [Roseomonas sp. OT10]